MPSSWNVLSATKPKTEVPDVGTPEVETPEEAAAREEAVEKSAYSPQEEAYRRSRMAAQRDVEKDTVRTVAHKHNTATKNP